MYNTMRYKLIIILEKSFFVQFSIKKKNNNSNASQYIYLIEISLNDPQTFQNLSWTNSFSTPLELICRFGSIHLVRFIDSWMDYEEQDTFILKRDALFSFFLSLDDLSLS